MFLFYLQIIVWKSYAHFVTHPRFIKDVLNSRPSVRMRYPWILAIFNVAYWILELPFPCFLSLEDFLKQNCFCAV